MPRPFVIAHMMSSIDGRLRVGGYSLPADGKKETRGRVYQDIHERLQGDAWMCGRVTMTEFFTGEPHPPKQAGQPSRTTFTAPRKAKSFAIAVDPKGALHLAPGDLEDEDALVLLGRDVSDAHLAELAKDGVSYVVSREETFSIGATLPTLKSEFGIERLLVEGGGILIGEMMAEGLIDEFSLVLYPGVDGTTGAPTIVEAGPGGAGGKVRLSTIECNVMDGGIVWVRYAVKAS